MRRGVGRGRRGPSLLGSAARTAVVVGTASAVSGRVSASQQAAAAPAPVAGQAASPDAGDILAQLTQLGDLKTAGVLTDEEFAVQKARILGQ